MTLVVPNVGEVAMLNKILNQVGLVLKLYSNDKTPLASDTAANYTEVVGGGYANFILTFANWSINPNTPTFAIYLNFLTFQFTGVTSAPGTIFGYFIVDSLGTLLVAERFPIVPFVPVNGSVINIKPRITLGSVSTD